MRRVLTAATPSGADQEWVLAGMSRPVGTQSRPGEMLRFEGTMKALEDSGLDPKLDVLHCFAAAGGPNLNHFVLADLIAAGHVVMTVNFDALIEVAYSRLFPSGPSLSVAIYDDDFLPAARKSGPFLWKLHGSLSRGGIDTRESVGATLVGVMARTPAGHKYRFFADVLRTRDVLLLGYSGWDDFDLTPMLAETPSDKRLIWVQHHSSNDRVKIEDAGDVKPRLAEWELDCVARDRVFFNESPAGTPTRASEDVLLVTGPTSAVRDAVVARLLQPRTYPIEAAAMQRSVDEFFAGWSVGLGGDLARAGFLLSAFETRNVRAADIARLQKLTALRARLLAASTYPRDRVSQLVDQFNRGAFPIRTPQNRHAELRRILEDTQKVLAESSVPDQVLGLRLLGQVAYRLHGVDAGDRYFEESISLAREHGLAASELITWDAWRRHFCNSLGEGMSGSRFKAVEIDGKRVLAPVGFDDEAARSRIAELVERTGYLPVAGKFDLEISLPALFEERDPEDLLRHLRRLRRHAINVGDVWGEARLTLRLAHLLGQIERSGAYEIELLRVFELEEYTGATFEEEDVQPFALTVEWFREKADLHERIRRSMWGAASVS